MATQLIYRWVAKKLFEKGGAIANKKSVNFSADHLEKRLVNFGVDPAQIKSENELNHILAALKKNDDAAFNQRFGNVLKGNVFEKKSRRT